ncbi:MAG: NADP-dependent isocitrate dehydrogenase, partial [Thiotrichaceae bacterium]|nr:NADP-dependent isocitrate dehydrogenase [Thiotrichaceae bacterium]
QQFLAENHLRWDSLGEFLALSVSLEHIANIFSNDKAQILAETLDKATAKFLQENKSPSRKTGELDNRGSHFYLTLYWAQELAQQSADSELKSYFSVIAGELSHNEQSIIDELNSVQGQSVELNGYYHPEILLGKQFMRPSTTFNAIVEH